jgi:hypothetical protein
MGVHSGPVNDVSDLNAQLNMEPVSLAPERLANIQFKVTLPP